MADRSKRQTGLLIVAHGERGGSSENRLAHALAERMRASGRYAEVKVGFLRAEPRIEAAATRMAAERFEVYPLFMSDGYYVRQAIPERLGASAEEKSMRVLAPLGVAPKIPALIADLAHKAAVRAGMSNRASHLLLVAHGSSKSDESAAAARAIAEQVAKISDFASVEVAFLEEEPFLDRVLSRLPGPAVILGLFAGDGLHAGEDLPTAVAKSGRRDVVLCAPIALEPALLDLIVSALVRT